MHDVHQLDYTQYADEQLLHLVNQRHLSAYEVFYDRHAPGIYNLLIHIVCDANQAAALLETLFLQLWQEPVCCHAAAEESRWLYRRARAIALDQVRQQKSIGTWQFLALSTSSQDQIAGTDQTCHQVVSALQQLPTEQRQCLELAYFAGLNLSEIASHTNLPQETIKSHLRLGIACLEQFV